MNSLLKKALLPITLSALLLGSSAAFAQSKIGAVVATLEQIKSVVDKMDADRSVLLEIDNNTNVPLKRSGYRHISGGFATTPKSRIAPKSAEVFGSQQKGSVSVFGTEGTVTYTGTGLELMVTWNNPYAGSNNCSARLSGPKAAQYEAVATCGVGNKNAHMRYELFKR